MESSQDIRNAGDAAQWAACYALAHVAQREGDAFDWGQLARAMFHAGEALAYHRSRDVAETLEAKLKAKKR